MTLYYCQLNPLKDFQNLDSNPKRSILTLTFTFAPVLVSLAPNIFLVAKTVCTLNEDQRNGQMSQVFLERRCRIFSWCPA